MYLSASFYEAEYNLISVRPVEYQMQRRTPPKNLKPHIQETPKQKKSQQKHRKIETHQVAAVWLVRPVYAVILEILLNLSYLTICIWI